MSVPFTTVNATTFGKISRELYPNRNGVLITDHGIDMGLRRKKHAAMQLLRFLPM